MYIIIITKRTRVTVPQSPCQLQNDAAVTVSDHQPQENESDGATITVSVAECCCCHSGRRQEDDTDGVTVSVGCRRREVSVTCPAGHRCPVAVNGR